ncbi:MAG: ABC transporter ATP-binding protein [Bacteroidota bacterium]
MDTLIKVEDLSASFDDRSILSDVSFTVERGNVTVILGSSGSGKTTILKHLLGLYPVQQGRVSVFGTDIEAFDEAGQFEYYLKIGVFYQNGALLNSLTVGENISLPVQQHTQLPPWIIEQMVRTRLKQVHLEDCYALFPSQLSGGMLKRAALARAIIMDPQLLFCDEPGAGLDPVSLASLDELILSLKKQFGMTVVMITHEVPSIMRVADKIIFLDEGKVIFEGSLDQALQSSVPVVTDFFSRGTGK